MRVMDLLLKQSASIEAVTEVRKETRIINLKKYSLKIMSPVVFNLQTRCRMFLHNFLYSVNLLNSLASPPCTWHLLWVILIL